MYLTAAIVLIVSMVLLLGACQILLTAEGLEELWADAWFFGLFLAGAAYGLFGVITSIGMMRLRPWAWSCGRGFFAPWIVFSGLALLSTIINALHNDLAPPARIVFRAACFLVAVVLVVALSTRRQLFFLPKQESEE